MVEEVWSPEEVADSYKMFEAVTSTVNQKREEKEEHEPNLLEIMVKDMKSVPQVFFQGKEVANKATVNYNWTTRDSADSLGRHEFEIEAYGLHGETDRVPTLDTIARKRVVQDNET